MTTQPVTNSEPRTELPGWQIAAGRGNPVEDCTLIVATYRRPAEVVNVLEKTAALAEPPGEVLVIDGSPEDGVEAAVAAWAGRQVLPFDFRYVRSPKGLTRQRNAGIDLATRDYICFLDDDAVPLEGYFRALHDLFASDIEHRIGAVASLVVNELDHPLNGRWRMRLKLGLAPRSQPLIFLDCGTSNPTGLMKPFRGTIPVDLLPGCAMSFRREVFDVMRFSEFFHGYSLGEDGEMSLRVKTRWEVVWSGEARCEHHPAHGGRPGSFTHGRMLVRNKVFIWKRHRPRASWINRLRFHADFVYLTACDLAWFALRPWQGRWMAHAAGLLAGMAECAITPPRYEEPPVRGRYVAAPRPSPGKSGSQTVQPQALERSPR